jgi:hypothetical protein
MLMRWDNVSELQPATGLLFFPRWYTGIEPFWNDIDRVNEMPRRNVSSATFSTINAVWTDPETNLGLRDGKTATKILKSDTA